jgi:putative flippase GtrA
MRTDIEILTLYALFAIAATVANLFAQIVSMSLYPGPYAIAVSVLIGTAVGLPVKYVLDKRFIFRFVSRDIRHDGRLFMLYTQTAVLTTMLFWGTEYLFDQAFETDIMRYVGGAVGLSAGYFIKYQLDKRHVFVPAHAVPGSSS